MRQARRWGARAAFLGAAIFVAVAARAETKTIKMGVVGRPDQAGVVHVDHPVAEYVAPQQHFALPALEVPQAQPRARQPDRIPVEAGHLVDGHEDLAAADGGHQTGDERIVGPA